MEFRNWHEKYEYVIEDGFYDDDKGEMAYTCPECGKQHDNAYEATNCCETIFGF